MKELAKLTFSNMMEGLHCRNTFCSMRILKYLSCKLASRSDLIIGNWFDAVFGARYVLRMCSFASCVIRGISSF